MGTSLVLLTVSAVTTAGPLDDKPPARRADEEQIYDCHDLWFYKWSPYNANHIVHADCPQVNANGETVMMFSTLDLNDCIANTKNGLVWHKDGNAFRSCQGFNILDRGRATPLLIAYCDEYYYFRKPLYLSDGLYNYNGALKCRDPADVVVTPVLD